MSIRATSWARAVCARIAVPPKHRLTLMVISLHHHDKTQACFPSYDTLSRETGYRRRGVIEIVKELEANGLLKRQKRRVAGHQGSNNYLLFRHPAAKKWVATRVQKKAPDRGYEPGEEIGTDENAAKVLRVSKKTGGRSHE
jgi:hypothetical protein